MRPVSCLLWGHQWKRRHRPEGTYLYCTTCGVERLDDSPPSYGTGGSEYISGG